MAILKTRQPVLKPQDLLVALKIAVNSHRVMTFSELGVELSMAASEVHSASKRGELSHFITRESGQIQAIKPSLKEFILHGVRYAFPALQGGIVQGTATGFAAPPLDKHFPQSKALYPVWPDSQGEIRGLSLYPLYPSVPAAARADLKLYEILALIDAIRAGTAREREIAASELMLRLS